ncbi:MAG: TatD family hydrolase [Tannerella sp.]|jgi:TatD DNase family protein|nr:TatD family hydrolase [Tannerella sp.]
MKIIDTHTHLYLDAFDGDREQTIRAAKESGIEAVLLPNIDASTIAPLLQLCDAEPGFAFPMMGLHPTSVDHAYAAQLKAVESALAQWNYCGIGEIGIDLYWDKSRLKEQKAVFEEQLRWSIDLRQPVAIHTRNAFAEVLDSIHKVGAGRLKGVFHCFDGTQSDLDEIRRLNGFKIGINGILTFKKSHLPEIIGRTPIEMLLLETDAPYLAPSPYRGKRNEPFFLWETAKKLASILEISLESVAEGTKKNTLELFNIQMNSL